MKIECPECGKESDVTDKLPSCACDENDFECECGAILEIGWYATAEVRAVKVDV